MHILEEEMCAYISDIDTYTGYITDRNANLCLYIYICTYIVFEHETYVRLYGVATVSRIDKSIGLICKRAL